MADLDTPLKRFSGHQIMMPWRGVAQVPDGAIAQRDRQSAAFLYSGILSSAPATVAVITGTLSGSTEEDIAGKTLIITLQYDTWVTAGATFDGERQNILDDIATTHGILFANQPVTTVVRTSDTVVTITLVADPLYDIASNDTGTVTVPSSALTNSLVAVVGTPTFTITFVQPVTDDSFHAGASNWTGRLRKKKPKTIRFAEFETQEARAAALAEMSIPIVRLPDGKLAPVVIDDDDEFMMDDELIIKMLFLTKHLH